MAFTPEELATIKQFKATKAETSVQTTPKPVEIAPTLPTVEPSRFEKFQEFAKTQSPPEPTQFERVERLGEIEQKTQGFQNSTASLLGLKPTQLRTGSPEFKEALAGNVPEAPTVVGGLKEVGKTLVGGVTGAFGKESIFGGSEIGDALGSLLAGQPESIDVVPLIADMGIVALDLLTLGKGKAAATALKVAGKEALKKGGEQGFKQFLKNTFGKVSKSEIAKQAAIGGGFGGLQQTKTGGDLGEIATGTAIGAGIGGAIGGAITGVGSLVRRQQRIKQQLNDTVGQIIQGTKQERSAALRTLKEIDVQDVNTYTDLKEGINARTSALGDEINTLLDASPDKIAQKEFVKVAKVGDKTVKQDFVAKSLDDLEEAFEAAVEPENVARIQNLRSAFKREGLNVRELNDLAKEYGTEFKTRAFTKKGDQKTTVTADAFENTRKGLKNSLRGKLPGENAKLIDSEISDSIKTNTLIEKMEDKVTKLSQKVSERGLLEKGARTAVNFIDALTFHSLKGAASAVFPSNVGLKTLNSLTLQERLQKNLIMLQKLEKKSGKELEKEVIKISDNFSQNTSQ